MNFNYLSLLVRYAKEYGHKQVGALGISDTEHKICIFLFAHAEQSQDDVAQALGLDKTTVARALLSLEQKGYVLRRQNPENRRKNLLSVTQDGRQSIAPFVDTYDRWFAAVSSCLSQEEQRQFEGYCSRLLAAAQRLSAPNQSSEQLPEGAILHE